MRMPIQLKAKGDIANWLMDTTTSIGTMQADQKMRSNNCV